MDVWLGPFPLPILDISRRYNKFFPLEISDYLFFPLSIHISFWCGLLGKMQGLDVDHDSQIILTLTFLKYAWNTFHTPLFRLLSERPSTSSYLLRISIYRDMPQSPFLTLSSAINLPILAISHPACWDSPVRVRGVQSLWVVDASAFAILTSEYLQANVCTFLIEVLDLLPIVISINSANPQKIF